MRDRTTPLSCESRADSDFTVMSHGANGRDRRYCVMCGRSTEKHGVLLLPIREFPRAPGTEWRQQEPNICEECYGGVTAWYESQGPEWMRAVLAHKSVHIRLGETLKAFKGEPVPAATLEFVANQGDWRKRVRELRYLGWEIKTFKRKLSAGGRISSYYRLVKSRHWPVDPTGVIRQYERERAKQNKA